MPEPQLFSHQLQQCSDRLAELGISALGALFDLASQRLVRFAVTLTRNQHDAEDAVQAALVRVASEVTLLQRANSPWPYLLRMVRNEALLIARRKRRCSTSDHLTDLIKHCPIDTLEQEEAHRAVWSALRALPAFQAEVVVLKIWEEMTFAQIGEVLEVSPHTAASRYKYAIEKLTRILQGQHSQAQT